MVAAFKEPSRKELHILRLWAIAFISFVLLLMIPYVPFAAILPGDINNDRKVDLTDAIIALQMSSGINVTVPVDTSADVNGDEKIGLEEAIFILQKIADMRPDLSYFQESWHAGEKDDSGNLMSGTELMHIVSYKDKLYAANSLWMENDSSVRKACQIFVLDSPEGKWRLEHEFTQNNLRLASLKTVTFTTNAEGKSINPVSMLLAAPDVNQGYFQIYSRDDDTGVWISMSLGKVSVYTTTRAIGFHHDSVTGIDVVFAGTDTLGTIAGVYDPSMPGRIRWQTSAEFATPTGERVMSFCNSNGVLYCSTSRHIFKRTDGPSPSWQEVYFCPEETYPVGIRGMTSVPSPSGKGEVLLFGALSKVRHIDPANSYEETIELDMPSFLTDLWKVAVPWVLCAYNEFMPYTIPGTGETVWLFGFESSYTKSAVQQNPQLRLFIREDLKYYYAAEGHYFIRHATDNKISYELGEVISSNLPTLVAVRTIATSPFSADQGQVLYFGGFDCNYQPSHNTAWIYKGILKSK